MRRSFLAGLLISFSIVAGSAHANAASSCSSNSQAYQPLTITVGGTSAAGFFALPATPPKGIVVVGHGYPNTALEVAPMLTQMATDDGVIALAMDYHGTVDVTPTTSRGWRVAEGAEDSIAAAKLFDNACHPPGPNTAFGISMGGNMTGLAV